MALLVVCTLLLGLLVSVWLLATRRRRRADEAPLVRSWIPYLGCALRYGANPLAFLREQEARHGEVFTCLLAGNHITFVCDPLSYSAALRNVRSLDFQQFALETAEHVFAIPDFSDPRYNVSHEEIHDLFGKTLMGPQLEPLTHSMVENLLHLLKEASPPAGCASDPAGASVWKEEGLDEFCKRVVFEASCMTIFGRNFFDAECSSAELLRSFSDFDGAFPLLVAGVPLWAMRAARRGREALETPLAKLTLDTMVEPSRLIIERTTLFNRSSVMTALDKARTHSSMLWASQANSLPAIFWTLFYLLRSAPALQAVRAQIAEVLGPEDGDHGKAFSVTKEQLNNMTVLQSVTNEALRLSSGSMVVRRATEDTTLTLDSGRPLFLRKGDMIGVFPRMMHFDPSIYPDPTEFKYDRFLDGNLKEQTTFTRNGRRLSPYLMPFGAGKSMCPGRHFAVNEMKLMVVTLLSIYDLELSDPGVAPPPVDISRAGLGILAPTHDVKFRYRLKRPVPSL